MPNNDDNLRPTAQIKTIQVMLDNTKAPPERLSLVGLTTLHGLRLVRFSVHPKLFAHQISLTVAGHPRRIRDFHDELRGTSGSIIAELIEAALTPLWRGIRYRNEPPIDDPVDLVSSRTRTVVYWKPGEAAPDSGDWGPVWLEIYSSGQLTPAKTEHWPHWARRNEASGYAAKHGLGFVADE